MPSMWPILMALCLSVEQMYTEYYYTSYSTFWGGIGVRRKVVLFLQEAVSSLEASVERPLDWHHSLTMAKQLVKLSLLALWFPSELGKWLGHPSWEVIVAHHIDVRVTLFQNFFYYKPTRSTAFEASVLVASKDSSKSHVDMETKIRSCNGLLLFIIIWGR